MKQLLNKRERERVKPCCGRLPLVEVVFDLSKDEPTEYYVHCPICDGLVIERTFYAAVDEWNKEVENEIGSEEV